MSSIGVSCARSSRLPCGTPSTMSKSTTSPSFLRPISSARVPPILPAPMSAIFRRAIMPRLRSGWSTRSMRHTLLTATTHYQWCSYALSTAIPSGSRLVARRLRRLPSARVAIRSGSRRLPIGVPPPASLALAVRGVRHYPVDFRTEEDQMDEDTFNMALRKFLKRVGVTSQREIETAVRAAHAAGRLAGKKDVAVKMTLTIDSLGLRHEVNDKISVA